MIQFILFDLLDGLLIGITNAIFMLIAGYPYVPLISVIVGVTNLAPTFGPILETPSSFRNIARSSSERKP